MDIAHTITHLATFGLPAGVLSVVATYGGKVALAALAPEVLRERTVRAATRALLRAEDDAARARAAEALRLLTSTPD